MKSTLTKITLFVSAAFATGSLMATPFGLNVTISDGNYSGSGWYSNREDQETETNPNTVTNQAWDLEGMFMQGTQLTLVGGYDFKNGVTWSNGRTYDSGDIFIDVTGDAKYGSTNTGSSVSSSNATTANTFGWDYVLDLNFSAMTYNVLALSSTSRVTRVTDVATSNPWTYHSGGTAVLGYQNVAFTYTAGLTNANTGFLGDSANTTTWSTGTNNNHYAIAADVGFISGSDATFHYTMECGNDNLMGSTHVPDAGATSLLLGLGLAGLVGFRRKLIA
jgi:hypothetical protein